MHIDDVERHECAVYSSELVGHGRAEQRSKHTCFFYYRKNPSVCPHCLGISSKLAGTIWTRALRSLGAAFGRHALVPAAMSNFKKLSYSASGSFPNINVYYIESTQIVLWSIIPSGIWKDQQAGKCRGSTGLPLI